MTARPSLTAFVGQPSSFFVGEQLVVQTSGVNTAQLERIDVGVRLSVTPSQVRPDGAQFRLEADRSFFSDVPGGTFREQLSIFKQSVSATADVRYGETLVLSGLQEQVFDHQDSKVPGIGDVPGPNLLLNQTITAIQLFKGEKDKNILAVAEKDKKVRFFAITIL